MTIGERLADARRRLGKSLIEAEQAIRVRAVYLEALEDDRFDSLPGEAYVRAFIRTYAKWLGLDPEDIIKEYNQIHGSSQPPEVSPRQFPQAEQAGAERRRAIMRIVLIAGLILVVLVGIRLILPAPAPETQPKPPPSGETTPASSGEVPQITQPSLDGSDEVGVTTPTGGPGTVTLSASGGRCWVRVSIDGTIVLETTLEDGESRVFDQPGTMTVRIGNPEALRISIGGAAVAPTSYARRNEITIEDGELR